MLLRDIRNIMETEDETPPEDIVPKARKTKRQKKIEKTTTDGVGAEAYDEIEKISSIFRSDFKIDGKGFEVKDHNTNTITIYGANAITGKNGTNKTLDDILPIIQQLTKVSLDDKFELFDIIITPSGKNVLISIIKK